MEIYKTFIFHAAHRMTNMPKGHEYSKIHGHSFTVDIYVKGSLDRENGWVMDFKEIEKDNEQIRLPEVPKDTLIVQLEEDDVLNELEELMA